MSKSKEGKISIANILALAGLAALGVLTFFGSLMQSSDGKPGGAIIWAVVVVAVLGFLLFMSIKAKSADNNPDKWRFVEWGSIALYIICALLFSSSFQKFFYIMSEKSSMQSQARSEIKAIKTMHQEYEYQQKKAIVDATEQINNYLASGQNYHDELADYVQSIGSDINGWAAKAEAVTSLGKDQKLSDIESRVEDWGFMDLAALAVELEEYDSKAWSDLEDKIRDYGSDNKLIPVIDGGGVTPYRLNGYAKFDLGKSPEAVFSKMMRENSGNTAVGWIVYVILNLLILLNYLVASRSNYVGPTVRKGSGGGLDL